MSFFQPNINFKGRLVRGTAALLFLAAAVTLWLRSGPGFLIAVLFLAFFFTAFEALRGWCVARACGIKTKI